MLGGCLSPVGSLFPLEELEAQEGPLPSGAALTWETGKAVSFGHFSLSVLVSVVQGALCLTLLI